MRKLCTIALLFFFVITYSQTDNIKFKHLTTDNGLSHNTVLSVFKDSHGYLWIGTSNSGINKYDGYNFNIYKNNPKDSNSISNSTINQISEDENGTLWVVTQRGLNYYNREQDIFTFVTLPVEDNINGIYIHKNGNFYLTTTNTLVFYNPKNKSSQILFTKSNELKFDFFTGKSVLFNDNILLIGTNQGLYYVDILKNTFSKVTNNIIANIDIENIKITALCKDSKGRIWAGSNVGLFLLTFDNRISQLEFIKNYVHDAENPNSLQSNLISAIEEDKNGLLWVAETGLSILDLNTFDIDNPVFHFLKNDPQDNYSLCSNTMNCLYRDNEGTIWIGSQNYGVDYFNSLMFKFTHIKYNPNIKNGLNGKDVNAIFEDDRYLWIGSGSGLNRFDRANNKWEFFVNDERNPKSIGSNNILAILKDSKNRLWVGTWGGGLNLFNEQTKTFTRFMNKPNDPTSISSNNMFGINEDKDGNIWIATMGGGLNKLDPETKLFKSYIGNGESTSISSNWTKSVIETDNNEIWVATSSGIDVLNKRSDSFTHLKNDENDPKSLSNNKIICFYKDTKNAVWVGTEFGLNRYNNKDKNFTRYTEEDGLCNNVIRGICEDNSGNIWISTNKGLSQFKNGLNNPDSAIFINYYKDDGLQANDFASRAFFRGKDDKLYFGGANGLNIVEPEKISLNQNKPKVIITGLWLLNKQAKINAKNSPLNKHISFTEEIKLSYDQNIIKIDYAFLNLLVSEKNQYAYMMEGFDKEWNYVGNQKFATYTNLDPGKYTFRVKAANNDGLWNEEGTQLKIIIRPPWWATTWFRILALATLITVIAWSISFRTRQLKKNQIILENKVYEATEKVNDQNLKLRDAQLKLTSIMDDVKNELGKASEDLLDASNNQASTAEEISASMEEIASEITDNADGMLKILDTVKIVKEEAEVSVKIISETLKSINDISKGITFISEFARMTNLLSLNASIEAARAGVHGKSFAVVASQVKKLADQSAEVAVNIQNLSDNGQKMTQTANDKIYKLNEYIKGIVSTITNINQSIQAQSSEANQVNDSLAQMSMYISNTSKLAEKLDAAINSLTIEE